MKKDLNTVFDELVSRYVKTIEKNYQARYKKSKDKEFIKDEIKTDADFVLGWALLHPENKEIIDVFSTRYKRGEEINDILNHIRQTYGEIDDVKPYRRIENGKKIEIYLSEEEQALKKLALDQRKLLKVLIRDAAYRKIQKLLPTMFDVSENTPESTAYPIKWTEKKDNKNEFVQLIYGLHKAGLINEGKGEITKIVESLAGVFKIDLGKGWQANHSSSIHKAKNNYQPPVFDRIKEAYHEYFQDQIESKKKK